MIPNDHTRIGIIGAGAWAAEVLACLQQMRRVRVTGIYNRTLQKATQLAERFGVDRVFERLEALCAAPDVDAVMVLTHESAHLEPTIRALEAGKHVFVEKPMADTVEAARRMAEAARQSRRILMPGHLLRFTEQCRAVKLQLDQAGPVRAIRCHQHRTKSLYATYCKPHIALSLLIHHLDLCRWLIGCKAERVMTWERFHLGPDYPSSVWAVLEFENAAVATLQSGWVLGGQQPSFWEDQIEVLTDEERMTLAFNEGCEIRGGSALAWPDVSYGPALRAEMEHWLAQVEGQTPAVVVSADDGVEAVALASRVIVAGTGSRPPNRSGVTP